MARVAVVCFVSAVLPLVFILFDVPKLSWSTATGTASRCADHRTGKGNSQHMTTCTLTWTHGGATHSASLDYRYDEPHDGAAVPLLVHGDEAVDPGDLSVELVMSGLLAVALLTAGTILAIVAKVRSPARSPRPPVPARPLSRRRDPSTAPPPVVRPYDS
jgi:hypothetical protein